MLHSGKEHALNNREVVGSFRPLVNVYVTQCGLADCKLVAVKASSGMRSSNHGSVYLI